jgi:glycosyltransferase involved in cell wall biosynthesis
MVKGRVEPLTEGARAGARPVRVLFLNTRDSLGADVSVHVTLARALDRAQARVWAATSTYEAPGASTRLALEAIPDLGVLPLDLGRPLTGRGGLARAGALLRNARVAASLAPLVRLCRRERIDLIHVTERPRDALYGLLLARLAGGACLIHAHTSYYRHDATRRDNWALRHADAVVGVSRFTADTYVHDAGLAADRVFAVHNALDSVLFRPDVPAAARAACRARLDVPADVPLIGCVARLSRWKGQATLLEALATVRRAVPNARLVLAGVSTDVSPDGQGDYKDYLVRRMAALGLDGAVTFAGFVPQHEMPAFYAALDVLAHPAVEEPFGLALIEAMAGARPVVAVGSGGVPEIIRDGVDGLLVPREQPEAMAAALVRVLRDPALAGHLARRGRERVSTTFTAERQAAAMLAVYRHVVAARAGSGHARRTLPGLSPGGRIIGPQRK